MTDEEKKEVVAFEVEYTVYVDIMHSQLKPTDVVVAIETPAEPEETNSIEEGNDE